MIIKNDPGQARMTSENKMILSALAEDLYRVATGLHSGKQKIAAIFIKEVLNRKDIVDVSEVRPSISKSLDMLPEILQPIHGNTKKVAEDALMYSIILRNYAQSL